jgi:putative zinc finger protein
MQCHDIQELILASFEDALPSEARARIDAHVHTCADCSRFALVQKTLDDRLTTLLVVPAISPASRSALRAKIHKDAAPGRADALPEIVHFGSFAIATLVMMAVLPVSPTLVASLATTLALASYVLLSAVRDSFDDYPLGADA